jgi:hypothetical protein
MALKSPWSVKGVSREDRDQAKSAAQRAGLPVGVWLSRQIRASGGNVESEAEGAADSSGADLRAAEPSRGLPTRGGPDSRFTFGPGQWSTATDAVEGGRISQAPPQPWPAARPPVMPAPPVPAQVMQAQSGPGQMMPAFHPGMAMQTPMASHWAMPPMAHPMYMQQPPAQPAQPPQPPQAPNADSEDLKALERKIESLQKRLAAAEARATKESDAMETRLSQFDGFARDVDALRMAANEDSEPNYSTAPVERAVMRLSERLQRIEDAILPPESGGGFFSRLFKSR